MAKNTKQPKAEKKPREHGRNRFFWILVYITLTLVCFIGVTLVLRQHMVIPGGYTPPEELLLNMPTPTPTLPPLPNETPAPTPEPTPYVRRTPMRIYFNEHELQSDLRPVGLLEDSTIDTVPSATLGGWFDMSSPPGDPGNSIISGHVTWKGKRGTFAVLHDMEIGEKVTIEFEDGSLRFFETVSKNTYAVADFPAYITDLDGESRLTLITCLGDYDRQQQMSLSRVVVECVELTDERRDNAETI